MDQRITSIGYPDYTGTYNYPVNNGNVILDPRVTSIPIQRPPLINASKESKSFNLQFIFIIILILILLGTIIYLYIKINAVNKYIDGDYTTNIKKVISENKNIEITDVLNLRLDTKLSNILAENNSNIYTNIKSEISNININDAKLFLPKQSSAINTYNDNFIMLSKNTVICDNVADLTTCTCLFDSCDQLSSARNVLLVDRPLGFNENSGITYSGSVIPVSVDSNNIRINNRFCLSFYINITKTIPENRIIFHWSNDDNPLNRYPSIIIRGDSDNDYGGKYRNALEIRFSNLGSDGIFNVTSDIRDNCLDNIPLYKWCHIMIMADGKNLVFYLNGVETKRVITQQDIRIGDPNQWIYIGKPLNEPNFKNPYGILLAKMRWFPELIPNQFIKFFSNEYLKK